MSHELIIAGNSTPNTTKQLQMQVEHAASKVRGVVRWRLHVGKQIVAALVECAPENGDIPLWQNDSSSKEVLIGLTNNKETKKAILQSGKFQYSQSGSENACIIIRFPLTGIERIIINNDGVGFIPAFYSIHGERFLFSTNLHTLLSLRVQFEWDMKAVIEYLVCKHPFENRTLLKSIECLPPGSKLNWAPLEGMSLNTESLLISHQETLWTTDKQTLTDEFQDVWFSVMKDTQKHCIGQIGLGLSGGLDSRAIACGLVNSGAKPLCFTFGKLTHKEVLTAAKIAERLGLHHKIFPVVAENILNNVSNSLDSLDGTHSAFEIYESCFQDDLTNLLDSLISGTSGDVFWGSDCPGSEIQVTELVDLKLSKYQKDINLLQQYLMSEYTEAIINTLKESLTKSFMDYQAVGCTDIFTTWNLENRQRRWGFALNNVIRRMGLHFENPFFHADFIRFYKKIPLSLLQYGELFLHIHRNIFSHTADIKSSSDIAGLSPQEMSFIYPLKREPRFLRIQRLIRAHPLKSSQVIASKCIQYVAESCRIEFISNFFKCQQFVFPQEVWLNTNRDYRNTFLHLLEEAQAVQPEFIEHNQLVQVQEKIYRRNYYSSHLLLGRIICLCLWNKQWTDRYMEAQQF